MRKNALKEAKKNILGQGKFIRLVSIHGWEYAERIHCRGIVIILAVTQEGKLIFTEQFRPPVAGKVIEYPAGLVADKHENQGESYRSAAKRELLEETGYSAQRMTKLVRGPSSSGALSAIVTFVLARGLKKIAEGGGDASENIKVHEIPFHQVERWLKAQEKIGRLIDPKIYAGLYLLNKYNIYNFK